jgi:hypothetical protein
MSITHETWLRCKTDYITGKGSLRDVAARHGVAKGSVEKKALKEGWTELRSEFEAAQLAKLIPPPPPTLPEAPVALDGAVSDKWLQSRMGIYYRRNAELLDNARTLLAAKLAEEKELSTDGLAKLTSALGGIVDAENKLLGLRDQRRGKSRRTHYSMPLPEPTLAAHNQSTDNSSSNTPPQT